MQFCAAQIKYDGIFQQINIILTPSKYVKENERCLRIKNVGSHS